MKTCRIYNQFGDLLAEGTIPKCAVKIGISESALRKAIAKGSHSRFVIEDTTVEPDEVLLRNEMLEACAAWDAFCEPIRQHYGIAARKQ